MLLEWSWFDLIFVKVTHTISVHEFAMGFVGEQRNSVAKSFVLVFVFDFVLSLSLIVCLCHWSFPESLSVHAHERAPPTGMVRSTGMHNNATEHCVFYANWDQGKVLSWDKLLIDM